MTKYTVVAYVNVDENYHFQSLKPTDKIARVDEFLIEAPDIEWAAHKMYDVGNKEVGPDANGKPYPPDVRSLSVGDLMGVRPVTGNERMTFFAVESAGFLAIPEPINRIVELEGTDATSRPAVVS